LEQPDRFPVRTSLSGAVTHFEIYAEDPAKLAEFYRGLFGWRVDQAVGIDYWRIQPREDGEEGLGGGLTYRPIPGLRSWMHYVNVPSIDKALAQVEALGGVVLRPKAGLLKTGWHAIAADPEGNIFAIWQTDAAALSLSERE
jgi:predicted enzyme related to lactoylglutathione lyase